MKKIFPRNRIGKIFPILTAIGIVILFTGCGVNANRTPAQNGFELSSTPDLAAPTRSSPTRTSIPNLPSPTLTLTIPPITLDPNHWKLFNSPNEILQSDVHHIGQTDDGTLWFGGIKIYRYDGKKWLVYDQEKIPTFRGRVIMSLAVAPGGTVLFGTEMNEIVSFDGISWISQTVGDGGYRKNSIDSILIRKNGELCAISIEGMSCQSAGIWTRHSIVVQDKVNRVYVWDAILTPTDEIWVPLSTGVLYHYDGKNWENSKISDWICCISASQDGSLWIYDHEGLGKRDVHGKIEYKWMPAILREDNPTVMREANDGTLWFGTLGGYQLVQDINGVFITADGKTLSDIEKHGFYSYNFPFYLVHCIFQAKDGSMWLGTVGGIFQYK